LADALEKELEELHKQGVCLRHVGRLERLDASIRKKIQTAIKITENNKRLVLNIAWNYGGRDEIIAAVRRVLKADLKADEISEQVFEKHLFTYPSPDPDLVIRTSGEHRTSNFLLWQSAYAEWYFTPILWPDFGRDELKQAIIDFGERSRRFGGRKKEDAKKPYAG